MSKSTLSILSESEESVACVGEKSPEQVLPPPKVNQFCLELEIERDAEAIADRTESKDGREHTYLFFNLHDFLVPPLARC